MILCPRFVFIHVPKNGGTFVKTMVQQIARTPLRPKAKGKRVASAALVLARGLPRPLSDGAAVIQTALGLDHILYVNRDKRELLGEVYGQHNTCRQIPRGYRHLPVVAVIRNPFDRYVSLYHYGEWKRYKGLNVDQLRRTYPMYPDIGFREFLEFAHGPYRTLFGGAPEVPDDIGVQTLEMIDYFAKDRAACMRAVAGGRLTAAELRENFFPVRFLRQETLNDDCFSLLTDLGYEPSLAAIAQKSNRVRPYRSVRTDENDWRPYYDSALMKEVLRRERLIFDLFPEYFPGPGPRHAASSAAS